MNNSPYRILAFLNVSFPGIFGFDKGVSIGEATLREMLPVDRCIAKIEANRDRIVGVKVRIGGPVTGELGLGALELALEAAEAVGLPLMTHIGVAPPSYADVVSMLRPGDILTHCYRPGPNSALGPDGSVLPEVRAARERGVLFDIAHGMGAFGYETTEGALSHGFPPDLISSDVHVIAVEGPGFDLLHTMSKLLNCGLTLPQVIAMSANRPALAIRRPELGHLGVGAPADITVLRQVDSDYVFEDVVGATRQGSTLLQPVAVYLAGRPMEVAAGRSRSRSSSADITDIITTEAGEAMSYKAIYTYAWDLAETGVAVAAKEFRDLGLDTVTIAGSYHAGKFMRPHGKAGKVYFPDDGTVYFNADPSRYGAIKPVANGLLGERDVLRELVETGGMAVNVWLVLLHNTRLGMAHPDAVVRNAFGDPYYYNLCPSAPDARAYAIGLASDVTKSYPVGGISLEAPGFTPYAHGYHHEFALMKSNPWLENMLGLCFCEHCVAARGEGRHRCAALQGGSRGRHRRLSRQRHRLSRRYGRGVLARRHRGRRRTARAISISAAASSPRWSPKSAPPCARTPMLR